MNPGGEDEVNFKDFYELQKTIYEKLEQIESEQDARFTKFEGKMDKMMTEDRAECTARAGWMKTTEARMNALEIKVGWLIAGVALVATSGVGALIIMAVEALFG